MKNIRFLISLYFIFTSLKSNGQSVSDLSVKICDSIKSHKYLDSDTIELKQSEIYFKLLNEYILKQNNLKRENFNIEFNSLNYKATRELNKTCDSFKIKHSSILPFSNLVDIDRVFSIEQSKKISDLAKEIRNKNRMQIVIVTIDELYPYNNLQEFASNKLTEWNIGQVFEKSGTIIILNKKLKTVQIATTQIAMKYLTNKDCDKLVTEIMIPNFKKNNYYEGIYKSLLEIKNILN